MQRVSIKTAGEVQQVKQPYSRQESVGAVVPQERRRSRDSSHHRLAPSVPDLTKSASLSTVVVESEGSERTSDRSVPTSISSIGGAVLRSRTADFERMLKIQTSSKQTKKSNASSEEEKKIKRKYENSRYQTRSLVQASGEIEQEGSVSTKTSEQRRSGVVYKRRELISSEPKERRGFLK